MAENEYLVQVRQLKKHFPVTKGIFQTKAGAVKAVDGISFEISRGETLGWSVKADVEKLQPVGRFWVYINLPMVRYPLME